MYIQVPLLVCFLSTLVYFNKQECESLHSNYAIFLVSIFIGMLPYIGIAYLGIAYTALIGEVYRAKIKRSGIYDKVWAFLDTTPFVKKD
jgi:hypothetical protein